MSRVVALTAVFLASTILFAPRVRAGGLEYAGAGASGLSRGGAVTARADDPMVLQYNPAGLAELRGSQLLIDMNFAMMSACMEPYGYYGWGMYGGGQPARIKDPANQGAELRLQLGHLGAGALEDEFYNDPLDTVCLDQHDVPIPQLAATWRLTERLGIGVGLIFPNVTPMGRWGGPDGVIRGDDGDLRLAATRYMQLDTGTFGVFPTIGVGYRVTDWLRVGVALEWGMVWVDYTTMAVVTSGTSPHNDVIAHLTARDLFIPAATASVHVVPTDSVDMVVAFRYQDSIVAPGNIDLTLGTFDPNSIPQTNDNRDVTKVQQDMPWKLSAGIRYARRLAPRPTGTGQGESGAYAALPVRDAFSDERWDVELDVVYEMNSRNQQQRLEFRPGQSLYTMNAEGTQGAVVFPEATRPFANIEKHWKDQVSVRAGGSYNIAPGIFGVSAGAHVENRGIDASYMQVDYWPLARLGLHTGIRLRVLEGTDILVSYAHIFQETLEVAAPPHRPGVDIDAEYQRNPDAPIHGIDKSIGFMRGRSDPPPPVVAERNAPSNPDGVARVRQVTTRSEPGRPPYIVNAGRYVSSIDVFAIGVHAHF